jgi:hypothetical protein
MGQNFIPDTVAQTLLFSPSLHDWLPEGHLARFLLDVVSALDLSVIYTSYQEKDGRGQAAYAPEMMVRLLLYGYRGQTRPRLADVPLGRGEKLRLSGVFPPPRSRLQKLAITFGASRCLAFTCLMIAQLFSLFA